MAAERVQRRLAAILAADVEGYSRLMSADEEATLRTLKTYREIIDGLIVRHDGRVFSTGVDSVLAEFASAVEAVRCAISIQEELRVRNAELAEDRRMRLRIGINVGDVMVEGDELFGDGVNVAARLEGLAEADGICISGSAFDQVKNKLSAGFEDIGPQAVKNIAEPVPAFRVVAGQVTVAPGGRPSVARRWRVPAIAAALVVVIATGGLAWWQPWAPDVEPASVDKMAFRLPDKPSIAVLPFQNLSGDPDQEYFSDGLTEDIITNIASFPNLFVIARNSTNKFRGKAVDIRDVAHDLGVRYVLEGSFRRAGHTLRITAQLIDGESGSHLWAERYDRDLEDIFAVQDEITENIAGALEPQIVVAETIRSQRKTAQNLDAWDLVLQAMARISEFSRGGSKDALGLLDRAIGIDPAYALGGRGADAFEWIEKARRLSPRDIFEGEFDLHESFAHFQVADYEHGAAFAASASMPRPGHLYPHLIMAACYGHLDAADLARQAVSKVLEIMPDFTLAIADGICVFVNDDDNARFLDGLRKAGVTRGPGRERIRRHLS